MFHRSGTHSNKVEITAPPDKLRLQHPPPALLVSQQQHQSSNGGPQRSSKHSKPSVSRHKSHPVDSERFTVPQSPSASDKRKKKTMFGFLKKKQSKTTTDHTDGGGQRAMSRTPEHFGRRPIQDNPLSVPTIRRPHSAASDRINGIDHKFTASQHYYANDSEDDELDEPKTPSTASSSANTNGSNPRLKPFRAAPAPPIPIQSPPTQSQANNGGYDSLEKYRSISTSTRSQSDDGGSLVSSGHFSVGSGTLLDPSCGVPGLIGVKNHGNTCYMNSVMQCLSNTEPLLYYFLSNAYKKDLFNKRKPGNATSGQPPSFSNDSNNGISQIVIPNSDGAVTECVGLLIKSLWNGQYESKISSFTREVVGLWGEQYRGTAQHDAQEFMLWLLDHLHEDLNHATGEKMTMSPVRKSNEEEMAAETLSDHLQRHDSLIYNLFSAQYHSSLSCPGCGHLSNTFDPYLCVSLSVPRRGSRPFYITMARRYQSSTKLMVFGMSLKLSATVKDIQRQLSVEARTLPHYLVISEMRSDGFFKFFRPSDPISIIPEQSAVYAFEVTPYKGEFSALVPHPSSLMGTGGVQGETIFIVLQCRVGQGEYSKRFGSPMCLRVWRDLTYSQLQSVVFKHMRQYLHDEVNPEVVCRDYIFFKCLVMDGLQGQEYLDPYCPSPFMSPSVEKALSVSKLWGYEPHIKLIAEWEQWVKDTVCTDIPESPDHPLHPSVMAVRDHYSVPLEATLDDCLEWHTKEEKLDEDETYRCSQCSKPQAGATKRISFWTLPDIMVIHFKRFEQDEYSHSKLNTFVKYPVRGLDMSPYLAQPNNPRPFSAVGFKEHMLKATPVNTPLPTITKGGSVREKKLKGSGSMEKQNSFSTLPLKGGFEDMRKSSIDQTHPKSKQKFVWKKSKKSKKDKNSSTDQPNSSTATTHKESILYDLFAVCNHHGNMDNGHYISVCCNPLDGQWYTYDDHRVVPVSAEDRLVTQHAYILLYLRRGAKNRYMSDIETSTEGTPTSHWIHRMTQFKMDLSRIIPSLPEPSVSKAQRQASAQTLSTASGVSPDMTGTSMPHIDPLNMPTHNYMSQTGPTHYHQLSSGSSTGGVPLSPSHSSYGGAYPQSPSHSTVSYFSQPAVSQHFTKRIGSYHGHTHHNTVSSNKRDTITRTATRL